MYRRVVARYAHRSKALTDLTCKEAPEKLNPPSEIEMEALEDLKQAILSTKPLALPRSDEPFTIDVDASKTALGLALGQRNPESGPLRPIGYWGRVLSETEQRYSATEREALALVWGVKTSRHYVEMRKFHIRTDHRCLK